MKQKVFVLIFTILFAVISLSCFFKVDTEYSLSERRPLEQLPEFSAESIMSGDFMSAFDNYVTDQFPLRDKFRSVKALFSTYLLNKKENNGIFTADGHISKIEYSVNDEMVNNAKEKFDFLYNKYLKDKNVSVYLSLIPDKNYFIAEKNGYPSIDYHKFINDFKSRFDYFNYIDILPFLSINDYYRTDSHWKQEEITDIAQYIAKSMGADATAQYKTYVLEKEFSGVYLGQSALPFKADTIKYLLNDILDNAVVKYFDTGAAKEGEMYNLEKGFGKDPYELFLSGTSPLIEIDNKKAESDKELVVFRDSYGSSLVPLLVPGYSKITVVDIRYIQSNFVGNFVEFNNQDVLFLYSTTLINNSTSFR